MASAAEMTAATSEWKVDGKTYRLSRLRDVELGEFEQWMQDRAMAVAERSAARLSPDARDALLRHAYDEVVKLNVNSRKAMELMATMEGAVKLLHLSLIQKHPNLTITEVGELVSRPEYLSAAVARMDRLNTLRRNGAKKKVKRPGKRSKAKRKRI